MKLAERPDGGELAVFGPLVLVGILWALYQLGTFFWGMK
jgi:hypothetical protein